MKAIFVCVVIVLVGLNGYLAINQHQLKGKVAVLESANRDLTIAVDQKPDLSTEELRETRRQLEQAHLTLGRNGEDHYKSRAGALPIAGNAGSDSGIAIRAEFQIRRSTAGFGARCPRQERGFGTISLSPGFRYGVVQPFCRGPAPAAVMGT
jgi:hypothetical protein